MADTGDLPDPKIKWINNELLEISIPNKSYVNTYVPKVENISIKIKYIPNDPVEREEFIGDFTKRSKI